MLWRIQADACAMATHSSIRSPSGGTSPYQVTKDFMRSSIESNLRLLRVTSTTHEEGQRRPGRARQVSRRLEAPRAIRRVKTGGGSDDTPDERGLEAVPVRGMVRCFHRVWQAPIQSDCIQCARIDDDSSPPTDRRGGCSSMLVGLLRTIWVHVGSWRWGFNIR